MSDDAWRNALLCSFMYNFAHDPLFHRRFNDFYQRNQPFIKLSFEKLKTEDTYGEYLADELTRDERTFFHDREKFFRTTGMDALDSDYRVKQLDQWLDLRARVGSLDWPLDEHLARNIILQSSPAVRPEGKIGDDGNPVVRIEMTSVWLRTEMLSEAVDRLTQECKALIRQQIEEICAAYAAEKANLRDIRPNQKRDLAWLYQRIAYRKTWQELANANGRVNRDTVQRKVAKLAKEIGVSLPADV